MKRSFCALVMFLGLFLSLAAWAKGGGKDQVLRGVININTATSEELQRLPGVGPKRAEDIIAYREKKPFTRISQLDRVKGIGPATMEKWKPHLTLEGDTDLAWVSLDQVEDEEKNKATKEEKKPKSK
jgi:competence protein ComEA